MGAWNVGAFDNDQALDTFAWFDNSVGETGIYGMIRLALYSQYEEDVVLASVIMSIIKDRKNLELASDYMDKRNMSHILYKAKDDRLNSIFIREAHSRICIILQKGNERQWIDWSARESYLMKIKNSLEEK